MSSARWTNTFPAADLSLGKHRPFRHGSHRLLVLRTQDGDLRATDALCPHEGYSMTQGTLKGCVLTCAWHNFKFDVRTGRALMGDEAVRTYGVRELDGMIQVDLRELDRAGQVPRLMAALETGLSRGRLGQLTRDTARLLHAGVAAEDLALFAVGVAFERSEYGGTHAPALALDVLEYLPRCPGIEATLPLAQLLELVAETVRGLPVHPVVPPMVGPLVSDDALMALVEAERGDEAIALVAHGRTPNRLVT